MNEPSPNVVVVGAGNVDMVIRSERLPRPGETVVGTDFLTACGGKGANQAVAARRLGASVSFVGRVGADGPGRFALETYQAEGVETSWVTVDPEAPTGVALIFVDRTGQNLIGVAPGANVRLRPADVRAAEPAFARARVLVTELEIALDTVRAALEQGRTRGLITVLNPAPACPLPDDLLALADWLTPNETEAASLAGVDVPTAVVAGRRLLERGARRVVVTLGRQGAVLVTPSDVLAVPAFAVEAVDATAAGDAFTAGLAVSLARGLAPREALTYACAAGALTTTRAGAQPSLPTASDVAALLRGDRSPAPRCGT